MTRPCDASVRARVLRRDDSGHEPAIPVGQHLDATWREFDGKMRLSVDELRPPAETPFASNGRLHKNNVRQERKPLGNSASSGKKRRANGASSGRKLHWRVAKPAGGSAWEPCTRQRPISRGS